MLLLRHRWFYLSCLAAFTAGHMVNYAVIIYAQEVIGSDLLSGIGFGLCFGPPLLLGWYAGVLCDRLAPGRLILAAQMVFIVAALLLWLADRSVAEPGSRVPWLVLAAALTGVGWSFVAPARMAALGQVASAEELKPASVIFNLLVMFGFGLGPLLIAVMRRNFGWPGVFCGAVVLLALASVMLLGVHTRRSGKVHEPVATEIRQGLAAVRANPLLAQLMVAAMAGYLAMGPMTVLLPKLAATRLGRRAAAGLFPRHARAVADRGRHRGARAGTPRPPRPRHPRWHRARRRAARGARRRAFDGRRGGAAVRRRHRRRLRAVADRRRHPGPGPEALRGRVVSMYTIISQVVPAASGVVAGALVQGFGVGVALAACGATLGLVMLLNAGWMTALRRHRG